MKNLSKPTTMIFEWGGKKQVASLCGYSDNYLKTARKKYWTEGIHYSKPSPKKVVYNLTLIKDWVANVANPNAHQKAINLYRQSLASSHFRECA